MFAVVQDRMHSVLYIIWKKKHLWVDKRRTSLDITENFMEEEKTFKDNDEILNPFFMYFLYSVALFIIYKLGLEKWISSWWPESREGEDVHSKERAQEE